MSKRLTTIYQSDIISVQRLREGEPQRRKKMAQMFEITYIRTGSGENKKIGQVTICTCDKKKNGEKANNIIGVIELFEEIMEELGTYENKNAIVEMKLIREW